MVRMKAVRLARGWSQLDLAMVARVAPSVISRIENGWQRPGPVPGTRLARALGLDSVEALTEEVADDEREHVS